MKPHDIDDWVDFLEEHNFENIQDTSEWAMANCIFHEQSDRTRPSLGINKESGVAHCLGCGSHSWEDLCEELGISSVDIIEGTKAREWESFKKRILGKDKKKTFKRFKLPKGLVDPYTHRGAVDYIKNKQGFSKRVIEKYNVKLCMDKGSKYYEHLVFPIYDKKGVLFFDARYVGDKEDYTRWRRPKHCAFERTCWNWEEVKNYPVVFFVEGVSDALKFTSFGLPTIPMKAPSDMHLRMVLRSTIENIVLMYDDDEAGRYKINKKGEEAHFTAKALQAFKNGGIGVHQGMLPKGADDPGKVKSLDDLKEANKDLFKLLKIKLLER